MASISWGELSDLINKANGNMVISNTRLYDDYMEFIRIENERAREVLYIQKEVSGSETYFLLFGKSIDGHEEFATINDAVAWAVNLVANIKFVYLPYDGEDVSLITNDPDLELTQSDDGETYKMTMFNVTLTICE